MFFGNKKTSPVLDRPAALEQFKRQIDNAINEAAGTLELTPASSPIISTVRLRGFV